MKKDATHGVFREVMKTDWLPVNATGNPYCNRHFLPVIEFISAEFLQHSK